jgi:hypothetical protein
MKPPVVRERGKNGITSAVIAHWKAFGVPNSSVFAFPNEGAMRQVGLKKGVFDLCVIGGNVTLAFLEIKATDNDLSEPQKAFKKLLIANGIAYAVTYGRDEPIRVLEQWGIVRPQVNA